ncbi:hypothetical protein [Marinoscillum sp.]|uniref:hypothetical protein n=1 Tax=Marinoscillum sp. TaxID=2024838 RepID=UPI003BA9D452
MAHLTDEDLVTYLEGERSAESEEHLRLCDSCQSRLKEMEEILSLMENTRQVDPPASIAWNVAAAVRQERTKQTPARTIAFWQIAAAVALLVVGFAMGQWSVTDHREEVIALRSQVDLLKEMSMINALQTSTASQRLQVVNRIEEEKSGASDQLVATLMKTLNTDESPNVRYAAAQALARFTDQEQVRLELSKSLEYQSDPLIQIALISILMEAQERNAVRPLRKLLDAEGTSPEVKQQAKVALEILS